MRLDFLLACRRLPSAGLAASRGFLFLKLDIRTITVRNSQPLAGRFGAHIYRSRRLHELLAGSANNPLVRRTLPSVRFQYHGLLDAIGRTLLVDAFRADIQWDLPSKHSRRTSRLFPSS